MSSARVDKWNNRFAIKKTTTLPKTKTVSLRNKNKISFDGVKNVMRSTVDVEEYIHEVLVQ